MIQTRSTLKKLLLKFTTAELLQRIAGELVLEANHYRTIGAPMKAAATDAEVAVLREAYEKLFKIMLDRFPKV